jgi:hypothetical protein
MPMGPQQASFDDKENTTTARALKGMGGVGGGGGASVRTIKAGPASLKSGGKQIAGVPRAFGADLTNKQRNGQGAGSGSGGGSGGGTLKKPARKKGPRVRVSTKRASKSSGKTLLLPDVERAHHSYYEEEVPRILDDESVRLLCTPQLAPRRKSKNRSNKASSKHGNAHSLVEYDDVNLSTFDFDCRCFFGVGVVRVLAGWVLVFVVVVGCGRMLVCGCGSMRVARCVGVSLRVGVGSGWCRVGMMVCRWVSSPPVYLCEWLRAFVPRVSLCIRAHTHCNLNADSTLTFFSPLFSLLLFSFFFFSSSSSFLW